MKNSSLHVAGDLLNEMETYYILGLQFSCEIQQRPIEELMQSWKQLEEIAGHCELSMEKLEKNPVQDKLLNEKLLEQARKNSNLMRALSKTLEKEKEKVASQLSKLSHVLKFYSPSDSSFQMSL
ncbi:MAG: hypothetical protein HQM15_06055 [Deltaproteobacteria bacterium]|nr:hypothetical protein [Deltaproteobacteria bacterium]